MFSEESSMDFGGWYVCVCVLLSRKIVIFLAVNKHSLSLFTLTYHGVFTFPHITNRTLFPIPLSSFLTVHSLSVTHVTGRNQ